MCSVFKSRFWLLAVAVFLLVGVSETSDVYGKDKSKKSRESDTAPLVQIHREIIPGYYKLGSSGGRAGLPEITLFVPRSHFKAFMQGPGAWLDKSGTEPTTMNYPGWNCWQIGVWEALMQVFSEQATNPKEEAVTLGPYKYKLKDSYKFCWSDTKFLPPHQLVLDLSDELPRSLTCEPRHYVVYGLADRLNYNGMARLHITFDKRRHVAVEVLESTLPEAALSSLRKSIENLTMHPVISFPPGERRLEKMDVIADFSIKRAPGKLMLSKQAN
jgi:hypothetical protein